MPEPEPSLGFRMLESLAEVKAALDAGVRIHIGFKASRPSLNQADARELSDLLESVVEQPDAWLRNPNPQFGGRRPSDLIHAGEADKVLDLLRAVDRGLF